MKFFCLFWVIRDLNFELDDDEGGIEGEKLVIYDDYWLVICCIVSRWVVGSEVDEGGYI